MRQALTAQHDWYVNGVVVATINPPPDDVAPPRLDIHPGKGIGGWFTVPDADDADTDFPAGRMGENFYPRATRGKNLTYNLRFKGSQGMGADGYPQMTHDLSAFVAAFADKSTLASMVVTPWPGYGEDIWGTFARVTDFDADDIQAFGPGRIPSPWQREPILTIRQIDGIWVYLNESGTLWTPNAWENLSGDSVAGVVNNGNAPSKPTITVKAVDAGDDVHVGRTAVGVWPDQELWFRDPVGAAGLAGTHDVVIDFPTRKVTVGGIDAGASYDAAASDWWDEFVPGLPPGTFTFWKGPGAGTGIHVTAYSAAW